MTMTEKSQAARAVMTGRETAAEQRATRMFYALIGTIVTLLLSVVGNLYQAGLPKLIPHIVEIDPDGRVLWHGPPGSYQITDVQVATSLMERWIENSRRRGDDPVLLGEHRKKAEAMSRGTALRQLQAYHALTNPNLHQELKKNPIRTTLHDFRVVKRSAKEYDIDWREVHTPTYGQGPKILLVSMRGIKVEIRQTPGPWGWVDLTVKDIAQSPTGVYVVDYTLTEKWEGDVL